MSVQGRPGCWRELGRRSWLGLRSRPCGERGHNHLWDPWPGADRTVWPDRVVVPSPALDAVLERYLAHRTNDDPTVRVKKVARPKELGSASRSWPSFAAASSSSSTKTRASGSRSSSTRFHMRAGCLGNFPDVHQRIPPRRFPPRAGPRHDAAAAKSARGLMHRGGGHRVARSRPSQRPLWVHAVWKRAVLVV